MARLLREDVVPHVAALAEEVVRFHLFHVLRVVLDPVTVLAGYVVVGDLEVVEGVSDVVELGFYGVPFPSVWEADAVGAER